MTSDPIYVWTGRRTPRPAGRYSHVVHYLKSRTKSTRGGTVAETMCRKILTRQAARHYAYKSKQLPTLYYICPRCKTAGKRN